MSDEQSDVEILRLVVERLRNMPIKNLDGITGYHMDRLSELAKAIDLAPNIETLKLAEIKVLIKQEIMDNLAIEFDQFETPEGHKKRVSLYYGVDGDFDRVDYTDLE